MSSYLNGKASWRPLVDEILFVSVYCHRQTHVL